MTPPQDWNAFDLGELFEFSNGINAPKSAYGSGTRFINILEVITKEALAAEDIPGRVTLPKSTLARYQVKHGDVLFNRTSETQDEVGLASVYQGEEPVVFGGFVLRGQPTSKHLEPSYAKYGLRALDVRRQIIARGQGGIRANVGQRDLKSVSVTLPGLDEQLTISAALDDVSALVHSMAKLIAKKRLIRQGMLRELLTGQTRLPEYDATWTEGQVGELAGVTGGGTPSTRTAAYWGGDIPWFTPAEIDARGSGLVSRSERTITAEGLANSAATLLPAGTVLITSRASIGNCAVAGVPVTTNQGFTSMIPRDQRSTWFLYYWTQLNKSALEARAAGSTFLEISASKVAAIPLKVPALEEQEAIGEAIRDADRELEVLSRRLMHARAAKTGMMQELLTGRTRLPMEAAS